jgi:hypothetical protein
MLGLFAARVRTRLVLARAFSVNTATKAKEQVMPFEEALRLCRALSNAKFDETIEVRVCGPVHSPQSCPPPFPLSLLVALFPFLFVALHCLWVNLLCSSNRRLLPLIQVGFNLGVDPRKPGQNLRGAISLPHGNGKKVTIAVMARKEKVRKSPPCCPACIVLGFALALLSRHPVQHAPLPFLVRRRSRRRTPAPTLSATTTSFSRFRRATLISTA